METIKTEQGPEVKVFQNYLLCEYSRCCDEKGEREKTLLMHRCSRNPSRFECEEYQKRNCQSGVNLDNVMNLGTL